MASGRVAQLTAEHIPSLVTRLKSYGAHSVQTRSILHLLHTGRNSAPFRLFAAGTEGADLVTVTAMWPTPGYLVLDICGREDAAGRRRLGALLRSAELAQLWRWPLRVEAVAEGLAPEVSAVAADRGLRLDQAESDINRLYVLPEDCPCLSPRQKPGVEVRPLLPGHLARVRSLWPHSDSQPDVDVMLADSLAAGLAVGVFITERSGLEPPSPPDDPVSWILTNSYGAQSVGHTLAPYRGNRLQGMALAGLTRRNMDLGLATFGHTRDGSVGPEKIFLLRGYLAKHTTQWLKYKPTGG